MNRKTTRLVLMMSLCLAICFPAFATGSDNSQVTVGEFLVKIASARNLHVVNGTAAAKLLRADGVDLPAVNPAAALTEGMVAAISKSLGIRVTTSRPQAPFGRNAIQAFLDQFEPEVNPSSETAGEPGPYPRPNDHAADPRTKGKGKKKGLPPVSDSAPL